MKKCRRRALAIRFDDLIRAGKVADYAVGAQIGLTAVLHTWGQNLLFHPHLHCVVTGGGLSRDTKTCFETSSRVALLANELRCANEDPIAPFARRPSGTSPTSRAVQGLGCRAWVRVDSLVTFVAWSGNRVGM